MDFVSKNSNTQRCGYGAFCMEETNEKICPISQEDLLEDDNMHPRKRIFISHSKDAKSIPYNVTDFKDWVSFQEEKGDEIKIPHCGLVVNQKTANNLKERMQFHLDAVEKYPLMTYEEVKKNGTAWIDEYIEKKKKGEDDIDLRNKINFFCDISTFSKKYLLLSTATINNSDLREIATDILTKEECKMNSFILRGTSIVSTETVKNYVFSVKTCYGIQHVPIRHRYGHGYFKITDASRFSSIGESLDKYNRPRCLQ